MLSPLCHTPPAGPLPRASVPPRSGDTNALGQANAQYGGWGGVFRLSQNPATNTGRLRLFYASDQAHTGFDNTAFLTQSRIVFAEDPSSGGPLSFD